MPRWYVLTFTSEDLSEPTAWLKYQSIFLNFGEVKKLYINAVAKAGSVYFTTKPEVEAAYAGVQDIVKVGDILEPSDHHKDSFNSSNLEDDVVGAMEPSMYDIFGNEVPILSAEDGQKFVPLADVQKCGLTLYKENMSNRMATADNLELQKFQMYLLNQARVFVQMQQMHIKPDVVNNLIEKTISDLLPAKVPGNRQISIVNELAQNKVSNGIANTSSNVSLNGSHTDKYEGAGMTLNTNHKVRILKERTAGSIFWVHLVSNDPLIQRIEYDTLVEANKGIVINPYVGLICAVKYKNLWLRAHVFEIEDDFTKVTLLETGKTIHCNEFRALPEELCKIPAQAIRITISNVCSFKRDDDSDEITVYPFRQYPGGTYLVNTVDKSNENSRPPSIDSRNINNKNTPPRNNYNRQSDGALNKSDDNTRGVRFNDRQSGGTFNQSNEGRPSFNKQSDASLNRGRGYKPQGNNSRQSGEGFTRSPNTGRTSCNDTSSRPPLRSPNSNFSNERDNSTQAATKCNYENFPNTVEMKTSTPTGNKVAAQASSSTGNKVATAASLPTGNRVSTQANTPTNIKVTTQTNLPTGNRVSTQANASTSIKVTTQASSPNEKKVATQYTSPTVDKVEDKNTPVSRTSSLASLQQKMQKKIAVKQEVAKPQRDCIVNSLEFDFGILQFKSYLDVDSFIAFIFPDAAIGMLDLMETIGDNVKEDPNFTANVGDTVAVEYVIDGEVSWVRATITKIVGDTFTVALLDYGIIITVTEIRQLSEQFLVIPEFCAVIKADKELVAALKRVCELKGDDYACPYKPTDTLGQLSVEFNKKEYVVTCKRWEPIETKKSRVQSVVMTMPTINESFKVDEAVKVMGEDNGRLGLRTKALIGSLRELVKKLEGHIVAKLDTKPVVGQLVLHKSGPNLFRAVIKTISESEAVVYQFDYGQIATVAISSLYYIDAFATIDTTLPLVRLTGYEEGFSKKGLQYLKTCFKQMFNISSVKNDVVSLKLQGKDLSEILSDLDKPNYKRLQDLPQRTLEVGATLEVVVLYTDELDKGLLKICGAEFADVFSEIEGALTNYEASMPLNLHLDELCVAKFEDAWYRAVVRQILPDNKYDLYYIDYGNSLTVDLNDIREIRSELIEYGPTAIACSLPEFGGKVSPDIIDTIRNKLDWNITVLSKNEDTYQISIPDLNE